MFITFEWDKNKADLNLIKHGISFDEAKTVFYDDFARIIPDPNHSHYEYRFIIQGLTMSNKIVVVSYSEKGDIIRIISARKATKKERIHYEENS